MKRIISIIISICVIVSLFSVDAFAASTALSGPSTVRSGDTITVTFSASGGIAGYKGELKYDSSVLTLQGVSNAAGSSWSFSSSGATIVAWANTEKLYSGSLFTARFKVNTGVSVGTNVNVSFEGSLNSSSSNDSEQSFASSYKSSIAAPLSGDATLSSLTVSNATLSPAFSSNTTKYSCGTVGFDVAKLGVSAVANDPGAKVSISGSSLSVGQNTVNITVTAANGAKKTYSISVTRENDPNYVASNNTKLSGITLSAGQLSPEFAADVTEYVVYVPYEVTVISIAASAADPLAQGAEGVTDAALKEGLNELQVKCIAEDGTEGIYKINVVRMGKFSGLQSITLPGDNQLETPTSPDLEEDSDTSDTDKMSPVVIAVLSASCLILGFAIGVLLTRKANEDDELVSEECPEENNEE